MNRIKGKVIISNFSTDTKHTKSQAGGEFEKVWIVTSRTVKNMSLSREAFLKSLVFGTCMVVAAIFGPHQKLRGTPGMLAGGSCTILFVRTANSTDKDYMEQSMASITGVMASSSKADRIGV